MPGLVGCTDMSVDKEDRPEQQLAKLAEVAEVAPIKHERHSTDAAHLHTHHQPQQPDTVQVRVSQAGAAEADPLQSDHPADLDMPAAPADSASVGAWTLPQRGGPECQPAGGAGHEGQRLTTSVARPECSLRHGGVLAKGPDMLRTGADFTEMGSVGGAQVKHEDVLQVAGVGVGVGFQTGATDMADAEEDVDIGSYVKAEQRLSRQASGSSASENGQAVPMHLEAQGRQPSPASTANSALLGQQATLARVHSCCHCRYPCLRVSADPSEPVVPTCVFRQ